MQDNDDIVFVLQVNMFTSWIQEVMNSTAEAKTTDSGRTTKPTPTASPEEKLAISRLLTEWLRLLFRMD